MQAKEAIDAIEEHFGLNVLHGITANPVVERAWQTLKAAVSNGAEPTEIPPCASCKYRGELVSHCLNCHKYSNYAAAELRHC